MVYADSLGEVLMCNIIERAEKSTVKKTLFLHEMNCKDIMRPSIARL